MGIHINTRIEDIDFSIRTSNCLLREGIMTIKDLLEYDIDIISDIRNLGRKSLKEIVNFIEYLELSDIELTNEFSPFERKFGFLSVCREDEGKLRENGVFNIFDLVKSSNNHLVVDVLGPNFSDKIKIINLLVNTFPFPEDMKIIELELSVRATNCLLRNNIENIYQLIVMTESDLQQIKNIGRKTNKEILLISNILKSIIDDSESFVLNFDLDTNELNLYFEWDYLDFLNIDKIRNAGYETRTVKELCDLYDNISTNPENQEIEVQRCIIRAINLLFDAKNIIDIGVHSYIEDLFSSFTVVERDIKILSMRLEHTLGEIAVEFELTRERIRQIIVKKKTVIEGFFYKTFLPNIIKRDDFDLLKNDDLKRAIFYSIYSDNSIIVQTNGEKKYYSSNVYNEYNAFAKMVFLAIKGGFQPEINSLFMNCLQNSDNYSDNVRLVKNVDIYIFDVSDFDEINSLLKDDTLKERVFREKTHDLLMDIIYKKNSDSLCLNDKFIEFISSEVNEFIKSFYSIWSSKKWIVKISDRFYEFYRACIRKFKFLNNKEKHFIVTINDELINLDSINAVLETAVDLTGLSNMMCKVHQNSDNLDFGLLTEVLKENRVYYIDNVFTTRCTISLICTNFMRRYESVIDTTEEDLIDVLNNYFIDHRRYIYRSRNIINALSLEKTVVLLDYNRFMLEDYQPNILRRFFDKIGGLVKFDINTFFENRKLEIMMHGIYSLEILIKIIEYYFNCEIDKFGDYNYRFLDKKFCSSIQRESINKELIDIASKYKNPNYTSILEKLNKDFVTRQILDLHDIKHVSEFRDFVEVIDLGELSIYDKSKSSRISEGKKKNLHKTLKDYELGFSFSEYMLLLEDISNNAINTKYYNIRKYYQIDKDVFIHYSHLDHDLVSEVKKNLVGVNLEYVTLRKIKDYIPNWINPFLALSILAKKNEDYSPIEQHGKLRLDNPILAKRNSHIYSLYNLIYFVLKNEYSGSFSESSVINYLQRESIIAQKKLPRYFFDLGFADEVEGIIVLKQDKDISESSNDELYDMLEEYFE